MRRALRAIPLRRHYIQARSLTTVHREPSLARLIACDTIHPPLVNDGSTENDGPKTDPRFARETDGESTPGGLNKNASPDNSVWVPSFLKLLQVPAVARPHVSADNLWVFYLKFRTFNSQRLASISKEGWGFLFYHQSRAPITDDVRAKRLFQLYQDMGAVDKKPSSVMRLGIIQSLFKVGRYKRALELWENCFVHDGPPGSTRRMTYIDYLELGALLHLHLGRAAEAHELAMRLLALEPDYSGRVLAAVFMAHIRENRPDSAYSIFVDLKEILREKARKRDYLAWLDGFLTCSCPHFAMEVFACMVQSGCLGVDSDSRMATEVFTTLKRISDTTKDFEDYSKVMLAAISVLPKPYHLDVYHHWMQRSTIERRPEAAAHTLELMFRQGLQPDSVHFNILLRVLGRTKDAENLAKCENIGWKMIEVAGDQVAIDRPAFIQPLLSHESIRQGIESERTDAEAFSHHESTIPPADSDTFAILLEHHSKAGQWEHVDYLKRKLSTVAFERTSALMNTLLHVSRRSGHYARVFKQFYAWTQRSDGETATIPDGASWRILWWTLRLAGVPDPRAKGLSILNNYAGQELPTPRALLAECVKWWEFIESRPKFDPDRFRVGLAAKDGDAIQKLMMHCFSNANDLPGQLVALHVLRKIFKLLPLSDTYERLRFQIIKWGLVSATARSAHIHPSTWKNNVRRVDRVYHILMQRRFQRMKLTGDDYATLDEVEVADLNLKILSEFIRVILVRQHPPKDVEDMIDAAKLEMGVPDLKTGDVDAFSVR